MKIASSGYVTRMHVTASRTPPGEEAMIGTAAGEVPPFVDVHEVLEILATEAMLAATSPSLWEMIPHREIDVSTHL